MEVGECKGCYVEDSLENQLSVLQNLGVCGILFRVILAGPIGNILIVCCYVLFSCLHCNTIMLYVYSVQASVHCIMY